MTEPPAARYRRFAIAEARGHSALYEALALGVAADPAALAFLSGLPPGKQQPNLLFAAQRVVCGIPAGWEDFRAGLLAQADAIRSVMLERSTQTNEPARCAVLLPILARLPQPVALIEVGASAGLCLLPDRYGYDYGRARLGAEVPMFVCRLTGIAIPDRLPDVAWRAGLDLAPVDVQDDAQVAWLEALIWPDQPHRLAKLEAAIAVARRDPPRVVRGDLLTDLPALIAQAPANVTVVVFHTAVLAYVDDPSARMAFGRAMRGSRAVWVSNEAPGLLPGIAAGVGPAPRPGSFLLAVDGKPVAWTDPHGAWAAGIAQP